jgi:hypothetical protein
MDSSNRVKVCHHVMSTSILMGLTSPLDDDLVHVVLRKITFAWDVHHLFKNRLPVKVVHKVYSNFCDPKVVWRACRTLVNFLISNLSSVHCQISKSLCFVFFLFDNIWGFSWIDPWRKRKPIKGKAPKHRPWEELQPFTLMLTWVRQEERKKNT